MPAITVRVQGRYGTVRTVLDSASTCWELYVRVAAALSASRVSRGNEGGLVFVPAVSDEETALSTKRPREKTGEKTEEKLNTCNFVIIREQPRGDGFGKGQVPLGDNENETGLLDTLESAGVGHGTLLFWEERPHVGIKEGPAVCRAGGTKRECKDNTGEYHHCQSSGRDCHVYRYVFMSEDSSSQQDVYMDIEHRPPKTFTFDSGESVWGGALLLGAYVIKHRRAVWVKEELLGLELGCGTGFCGLLASICGLERVLLTDGNPSVIDIVRRNIDRNKARCPQVEASILEWNNIEHCERIQESFFNGAMRNKFDIVFGSNILYTERSVEPFFKTAAKFLDSKGCLILSRSLRNKKMEVHILKAVKQAGLVRYDALGQEDLKHLSNVVTKFWELSSDAKTTGLNGSSRDNEERKPVTRRVTKTVNRLEIDPAGYTIEFFRLSQNKDV